MADQKPLFKTPYDIKDVSALFAIVAFVLIIAAIVGNNFNIQLYMHFRTFSKKTKHLLLRIKNLIFNFFTWGVVEWLNALVLKDRFTFSYGNNFRI